MKIIVISDSHDNNVNIDKMLKYAHENKIKIILHCGDVCAIDTMEHIAKSFKGDIYHVYGNVDDDHRGKKEFSLKYKNWHLLGGMGSPKIKELKKRVGMTHYPWQAKEMAKSTKYDIIFYGHSHVPWEEKVNRTRILNPGTLAGMFQKSTFAVWNTKEDKFELKIVDIL